MRIRLILLFVLAIVAAPRLAIAEPSPEVVQDALDRAYGGDVQKDLPNEAKAIKFTPVEHRDRQRPVDRNGGSPFGALSQFLMLGLAAVVIAMLLFSFSREFFGYVGEEYVESDGGDVSRIDSAVVARPLEDAEELASTGNYGQAIHVLLLRTLRELSRLHPTSLPRSLTSREALRALSLPDVEHRSLSQLISAVESCHFRGDDPTLADYEACRAHFDVFARAYMRGAE